MTSFHAKIGNKKQEHEKDKRKRKSGIKNRKVKKKLEI